MPHPYRVDTGEESTQLSPKQEQDHYMTEWDATCILTTLNYIIKGQCSPEDVGRYQK